MKHDMQLESKKLLAYAEQYGMGDKSPSCLQFAINLLCVLIKWMHFKIWQSYNMHSADSEL